MLASVHVCYEKYMVFMVRVRLILDARLFISNNFTDLRGYPCASRKYRVHNIVSMCLYIVTTSDSVKLVALIFCVLADPSIIPFPNAMYAPV